jgi:cold shock protein
MPSGRVKFFNEDRGYGFIVPDGGGSDVFVHVHDVEAAGMKTLVAGQLLTYNTAPRAMAAQRPSIFACLTRSVRNASLPPPALGKRSHGGLARRSIAVRRRAIFMVAEG